jgi:hypothetical protein
MHFKPNNNDQTAAYAEAFFIANLLFVGIFHLALWGLYFLRYKKASSIAKGHVKQALIASGFTTFIFIDINLLILLTSGYASVTALFTLEVYFMVFVPLFLVIGIMGFTKAVTGKPFNYPVLAYFLKNMNKI